MRCCSLLWLALCFTALSGGPSHAIGIEAAAAAEELVASCNTKSFLSVPGCLNASLGRKWKYELDYAGKPFSAVGKLDEVRTSLAGNLFAFVMVGQYRVGCQVSEKAADALKTIGPPRNVWIRGVVERYDLTFNLHRMHFLRLTPYCEIEPAV